MKKEVPDKEPIKLVEYKDFQQKGLFFSCNEVIDSEANFDKKFEEWKKQPYGYAFRGISEAKYKLYTSAQRIWINHKVNCQYGEYKNYVSDLIKQIESSSKLMDYFKSKGISKNDFLLLALLQHYGKPSPLLDFSYDPTIALYFAFDGVNDEDRKEGLKQYVSIYRIKVQGQDMTTSIQAVEKDGADNINYMSQSDNADSKLIQASDYSDVLFDIRNLSYEGYLNVGFMFVHGSELGVTNIEIPALGFMCSYDITNPRINSQSGLFVFNSQASAPLAEEIKRRYPYSHSIIDCYNVNKKLKAHIQNNYIKEITKEKMYPDDEDSRMIKRELENLSFTKLC